MDMSSDRTSAVSRGDRMMKLKNRKALEDAIVRMSSLYRLPDIKSLPYERLVQIYDELLEMRK